MKILRVMLLIFTVVLLANGTKIGKATAGKVSFNQFHGNQQPVAYIDSIKPSPADSGISIFFGGHGADDGSIVAYDWDSNQDGQLSTSAAFNKSDLSVNVHTIWFKVQDDLGMWSESVFENLTITAPSPPTDSSGAEWYTAVYPDKGLIGGWYGYPDTINASMADVVVYTVAEMISAINSATTGDIIYLMDTCEFNLTGQATITFYDYDGVTLASGRGTHWGDTVSHGALVYYEHGMGGEGMMFRLMKSTRITGIRFRGQISELEGEVSTSDFITGYAVSSGYALSVYGTTGDGGHYPDSCEIDNCEFWGFAYSSIELRDMSPTSNPLCYIHSNHFHNGNRLYYSYALTASNDPSRTLWCKSLIEANYFDRHGIEPSGGTDSWNVLHTFRYNIFSARDGGADRGAHLWFHGSPVNHRASGYIFNNTFQSQDFGDRNTGTAYGGYNDSTQYATEIRRNWSWDNNVQNEVYYHLPFYPATQLSDNVYTETFPEGLAQRIPTAVIWSSVDSGVPPCTVKFHARNSIDPDGEIMQMFWEFGDSCEIDNYARKTKRNVVNNSDTVQHIFHEQGKYMIRLQVVDDDGCRSDVFKTINVKPTNSSNFYLNFWASDGFPRNCPNIFVRRVLLQDEDGSPSYVVYEQDIAYDNSWEHVIVNVTDSINAWDNQADDSVIVRFQTYCKKDTSISAVNIQNQVFFDDIVLYGGNVINGDFETNIRTNWAGHVTKRQYFVGNDTLWWADYDKQGMTGHFAIYESGQASHGGWCGIKFDAAGSGQCKAGQYIEVYQKVDVLGQ